MEQITHDKKYHIFYQSLKDFVINTKLAKESDIVGASETDIILFEKKHNLSFPLAFRIFLRYFGIKLSIKRIDAMSYTLKDLESTMEAVYRLDVKSVIQRKEYLSDVDANFNDILIPLKNFMLTSKVVFLHWDEMRASFSFIDSTVENPVLFYLIEYMHERNFTTSTIQSDFYTFTSYLRVLVFLSISSKFYDEDYSSYTPENDSYKYEQGLSLSAIDLQEVDWAKVYTNAYKNGAIDGGTVIVLRRKFYMIITEKEKEENRLFTIHEFEWAFIAYLKEQGYDV